MVALALPVPPAEAGFGSQKINGVDASLKARSTRLGRCRQFFAACKVVPIHIRDYGVTGVGALLGVAR